MKDEYQKILGEFAFNSLDKQDGLTWVAFTAFFEKFYEEHTDIAPSTLLINGLKTGFSKDLTPEAKKWFCEIFSEEEKPDFAEPPKEVFYKIGDRFRVMDLGVIYQLSVSDINNNRVLLVKIKSPNDLDIGIIWRTPFCTDVDDLDQITQTEFNKICGENQDKFTLIEET